MAQKGLQKYLDKAVGVLEKYGIMPAQTEESQLANMLQDVVHVDEPKVLAIAKTVGYIGTFNRVVRDNVQDMRMGDRYNQITNMFDSIRDDSKKLLEQLQDGKIDTREKIQNLWMRLARGTPHKRFEKIRKLYGAVSNDTKDQLEKEYSIMDAYIDFRFALKDAEILSHEVLNKQDEVTKKAKKDFEDASDTLTKYEGKDDAEKSRLQLKRDEAERVLTEEDRKYQLMKDVAENLTIGYNVGETLIAKLKQTHDVKDQVYRKSVTFFTTNEHVFTLMDATYSSQQGLHEATQTLERTKKKVSEGLEVIADTGRELEKAALKAGYGSTLNPESVKKLVDAVVVYQTESRQMIEQLRAESEKNTKEIERIVDEGKERCRKALTYKVSVQAS